MARLDRARACCRAMLLCPSRFSGGRFLSANAFHENAGRSQVSSLFVLQDKVFSTTLRRRLMLCSAPMFSFRITLAACPQISRLCGREKRESRSPGCQ